MSKGNAAFMISGLKSSSAVHAAATAASSPSSASSASDPSRKTSTDIVCSGFEGQVFRKNRCKKCLRDKADHVDPQPALSIKSSEPPSRPVPTDAPSATNSEKKRLQVGDAPSSLAPVLSSTSAKNVSGILKASPGLKDKPPLPTAPSTRAPTLNKAIKGGGMDDQSRSQTTTQTIILSKNSPQVRRASSSSGESPRREQLQDPNRRFSAMEEEEGDQDGKEMRTPLSGSLLSMRTANSFTSNSDLQSMHTATSGSMNSLNSDATFISSREHYQETVDDLQATIDSLSQKLTGSSQTIISMEREMEDLREALKSPLSSGSVVGGMGTLKKRDELSAAQKRIKELEKETAELDKIRRTCVMELEQLRECMDEINDPDEASQALVERVRDMAHKLQSAEMMCEDLLDENQDLKKELRSLEAEMDELHDNFRQDQAMEFQTIQKELEQTMKNCRILQFKLRKSERKCDEVESDKALYEIKLRQLTSVTHSSGPTDSLQLREVMSELQQTKDVNKRLQEEIEHIEEERNAIKSSYDNVARVCIDLEQQKESFRLQSERLQIEINSLKPASSRSQDNGRQNTPVANSNNALGKVNHDASQLLRDLYESVERETDLRDQLNFSEEESKRLRKQLVDLEHENDNIQHQLKKLSTARYSGDYSRAGEALDTMRSNGELKMQLDITEHEISTLKRRLSEAEQANESLSSEIKSLQVAHHEVKEARDRMCAVLEEPESTGPGKPRSYYEQKIKLLEAETNDLRRKLVDKERQLERLSSEMEVAKRKGGQLNRSKSLDDYQLVDLRRQLQMAEQEIILLRQKVQALEADNDKLSADYKRLQFKAGSKRPSAEELLDVSRTMNRGKSIDDVSAEEMTAFRSELALLKNAGKSVQGLLEESASVKKQNEDLVKNVTAARDAYEKAHAKVHLRKDVATRQELKSHIEELEKDFQNATIVVEQERATAKRLLCEMEELRSNIQLQVPNLPISDEVKEARLKLYAAEQQLETLRTEIRDLQDNLMEEKRKSRISETDMETKERKDTELRNLKQELSKQRYLVEELTAKENLSTRQLAEWQKKYLSLKEAYKSDTDAWQKELSDFEQELAKEKTLRASDVTKSADKEVQSLKHKVQSYEDQIQNLIEAGKIKEKNSRDKSTKVERELEETRKHHDEVSAKLEQQGQELSTEKWKAKVEKDRLESKVATITRERDDHLESCRTETIKLRTELDNVKKTKVDVETEMEKLKQEKSSAVSTYGKGGLSAYERAKAADQIKEEVEKLHKQNYELQRQLLEAKRGGEEANELVARNERRLNTEKEEVGRKMRQDDKIHKAEISAITMRFENKQKLSEDETKSLNTSLRQIRKERETLQERLDSTVEELHNVRDEYLDTQSKLDSTANAFTLLKNSREGIDKQWEELQARVSKLDQERNDVKARAAKEKSTYELKISDLQDKLSQFEGQHVKISAYALRTRNLSPTSTLRSRGAADNDDLSSAKDVKDRTEVLEKALKKSEKEMAEARAQVTSVKVDKEREIDLLRAKIRELQDKVKPMTDAHVNLRLQYDIMRTECEIIRIERDDLAERIAEDESSQIKERGKIDQILVEIQRLKDVAPLFSSDEDVRPPSPPKLPVQAGGDRAVRGRERQKFYDEKSATLAVTDHKKYKGKKSADLQKAIDNITKVSEDIKAERRTRRPILPHKRSHSASLAEPGPSDSAVMRRFPSVDADDETTVVTLPAPTPLRSIPKVNYPARNPRFPSIPPSFLVTPPSVMRENTRSRLAQDLSGSVAAVSEECFRDPGGSWDSIDSDTSLQSWNYPLLREALPTRDARFVSLPNLPQKVDSATSTDEKPKRTIMEAAAARKKKILARLSSNHSSVESLKESVEFSSDGSSGFFERLSHPTMATQTSRSPSPSPQPSIHMPLSTAPTKPPTPSSMGSLLTESALTASATKIVVTPAAQTVATTQKEAEKPATPSISTSKPMELTNKKQSANVPGNKEAPASTSKESTGKGVKLPPSDGSGKKPLISTWRKPISDLTKKFENKGK